MWKKMIAPTLLLLVIGCRNDTDPKIFYNAEGLLVRQIYFDDGVTLADESTFEQDTIRHGYQKRYYKTGQLEFITRFKHGKEHGFSQTYYASGKRNREGWFKEGLKDSVWKYYDSLGRLKELDNMDGDKAAGEQLALYPDGNIKECYQFNALGEPLYKATFTSSGVLLTEEGSKGPTLVIYTTHEVDQWAVGEEYHVKAYFCHCRKKLSPKVEVLDSVGKIISETPIDPQLHSYRYRYTFPHAGRFTINFIDGENVDTNPIMVTKP